MTDKQPVALLLADAYADACFEQALNQKTEDPAPEIARDQLAAELRRLHALNAELLEVLKEARTALQFANDNPNGAISDTIWMMHRPKTLFDFMDAAIARVEGVQS